MPKEVDVVRSARGVAPQYNYASAPAGTLLQADNCVIDREGVISKRRGFARYIDTAAQASEARRWVGEYLDESRVIALNATRLIYEEAAAWVATTGELVDPAGESEGYRLRTVESGRALYICSDEGLKKWQGAGEPVVFAGVEPGMDLYGEVTFGTGGGWFTPGTNVAYRVVFLKIDKNGKEIIGAPTRREVFTNPTASVTWSRTTTTATITQTAHGYSNGDQIEILESNDLAAVPLGSYVIANVMTDTYDITVPDAGAASGTATAGKAADSVELTFLLPPGIDNSGSDYFEVYRSALSGDLASDPGDTLNLVARELVTSGSEVDVYVDEKRPAFLGETLYTNANQLGLAAAKYPPPLAHDACQFKRSVFYARTRDRSRLKIQLSTVDGIVTGTDTITVIEDNGAGFDTRTYTFETAESIGSAEFQLFDSEATEAENVEKTAKSFCKIHNRVSPLVRAFYASGADDPPGIIELVGINDTVDPFSAWSTVGDTNFSPTIGTSGGTANVALQEERPARLYYSPIDQADAVPLGNSFLVGRASDPIVRIVALNDAIIILKKTDGVYLLTGEDETSFVVDEGSPSVQIIGPESAVSLADSVYCYSNLGVVRIADTGEPALVSRDIETELYRLRKERDQSTVAVAAASESDKAYILTLRDSAVPDPPEGNICWRYNYLTRGWTKWTRGFQHLAVLRSQDALFAVANAAAPWIVRERTADPFDGPDYQDETLAATIDAVDNAGDNTVLSITWTDAKTVFGVAGGPRKGTLISRGGIEAYVESSVATGGDGYDVTMDGSFAFTAGAASIKTGIRTLVNWSPIFAPDPALQKEFLEGHLSLGVGSFDVNQVRCELAFFTNMQPFATFLGDFAPPENLVNIPYWAIRTQIPTQYRRGEILGCAFREERTYVRFDIYELAVVYREVSERSTIIPR